MSKIKKAYKTVAHTLFSNKMSEVALPTDRVDYRTLSKDDLKTYMKEEFEKAKDACEVEAEETPWGDSELEKEIEWIKALKIKEYFEPKNEKESDDDDEEEKEKSSEE
jgi:hypothetical protein